MRIGKMQIIYGIFTVYFLFSLILVIFPPTPTSLSFSLFLDLSLLHLINLAGKSSA